MIISDIEIHKIIRSKRRTIALQIGRDAFLIVRAPLKTPDQAISEFVELKRSWIIKNQAIIRERNLLKPKWEISDRIRKHLKKKAKAFFIERTQYHALRLGIEYEKVKITSGMGNWGSCRGRGRLIFNWRLILAPPQIIDYVIIHELIHIIERNHSRRYWNKISSIYPNYQSCKKWLKQNGHLLEI